MDDMRLFRLATLVMGFISLQLALGGAGVCRVLPSGSMPGAVADGSGTLMVGMTMPTIGAETQPGSVQHAPAPAPQPCGQSSAPISCPTSASCAPALAAAAAGQSRATVLPADVPALAVLVPSSLALSPELPPPRA